jgi:hypothetical protein
MIRPSLATPIAPESAAIIKSPKRARPEPAAPTALRVLAPTLAVIVTAVLSAGGGTASCTVPAEPLVPSVAAGLKESAAT